MKIEENCQNITTKRRFRSSLMSINLKLVTLNNLHKSIHVCFDNGPQLFFKNLFWYYLFSRPILIDNFRSLNFLISYFTRQSATNHPFNSVCIRFYNSLVQPSNQSPNVFKNHYHYYLVQGLHVKITTSVEVLDKHILGIHLPQTQLYVWI